LNTDIVMVGVDWGTTHRRAYGLDANGHCIAEHADAEGALACKGRFPQALQALLEALNAQPQAVLMAGMVGSALGWQVAPYADAGVALTALPGHLYPVSDAPGPAKCSIVPGYCVRDAAGQPDVMRGEETQLLGACCLGNHTGWFVLPGTHSKWVELREGRVVQLRTYMTGELYELLSTHGTLAAAVVTQSDWDPAAFSTGVLAATDGALSHQLFGCRARVVSGDMPAAQARAYLSGLLIGSELQDIRRQMRNGPSHDGQGASPLPLTVRLIGTPALAQIYQNAAKLLEVQLELVDARSAFIAATHYFYQNGARPRVTP
jgi:2-dehydro-3-deoxygalactonokinase